MNDMPEWLRTLSGQDSRKRKASDSEPEHAATPCKKSKGIYGSKVLRVGTLFGDGCTVFATLSRGEHVQFFAKPEGKRMVRRKVDFSAVELDAKFVDAEETTIEAILKASVRG